MTVLPHNTVDELHTLYRTETKARLARRLQAVWLARQGRTCPEIISVTGASRRSIQQWVARYNSGGVEELLDKLRSGRPAFLTDAQQEQLKARVKAGPREGDILSVFNAAAIDRLVEKEFGVLYSLRGMQALLGRLGFSYQCPRPRHEQSDPEAQDAFKKGLQAGWKRSENSTPASESKSTSRTKRGSGRRDR